MKTRLAPLVLVACAWGLPPALWSGQGLATTAAGVTVLRPSPHLYLAPGEGFVPSSPGAGAEWAATLTILRTGSHRFFVEGGSLRIDGQGVPDGPLVLEAGPHDFALSTPRKPGPLSISVDWEGPGFPREPVPPRRFTTGSTTRAVPPGRALFEDLGCANCHQAGGTSITRRPGPLLTGIGGRRREGWLWNWLRAPHRFRHGSTMPDLLAGNERDDVAAYLSTLTSPPVEEPAVRDRDVERGRTTFQSFGCAACHGSDLPLDGQGSKMTTGRIREYLLDPLRFSPDGRMPSFHLSEHEALELAAYLALSRVEAFEQPPLPGDPIRGEAIVRGSGCLACHDLQGLESTVAAPPLESLRETEGCLAESVPAGLPRYRLSDGQRLALRHFVAAYRNHPDVAPAPTFDLERRIVQLRCRSCHELNGVGPSGALAETAPTLTGVGAKLRNHWLRHVIAAPSRTLDWQELRMPGFGPEQAAWLADAFTKASGVDASQAPGGALSGDQQEGLDRLGVDGRQGGMGCIGCHGWSEYPSLGENGPNLHEVSVRLRERWFRRWMRDPARILPGTSMPGYFPGPETPASLDAIGDLWAAFRAAPELPPPYGFRVADADPGSEARPVPLDQAIVVRWDMPDATPASIAVGLPGQVSFCFDAGESRLRYAWRGGFVDLSRTLFKKKNPETNLTETTEILGEIFYREESFPIRVGERNRIPQRRFRGYRLVGSIPEFHYEADGVSVFEVIDRAGNGIVRRFRIPRVDQPMWFVPSGAQAEEVRSNIRGGRIPLGENVSFEVSVATGR